MLLNTKSIYLDLHPSWSSSIAATKYRKNASDLRSKEEQALSPQSINIETECKYITHVTS